MATVQVSNWTEFLAAIDVSGDVVECPENAVWDMNDIEPLGHMSDISVRCTTIKGNGTRIKNLRLYGKFQINSNYCFFNDILITDLIASGNVATALFNGNAFFRRSAVSCILSSSYENLITRTTNYNDDCADNSAFYVEATSNHFVLLSGPGSGNPFQYCRIEVHAPNATGQVVSGYFQSCEVIIYAANSTKIVSASFKGCTLRGNLKNVTEEYWIGNWTGDISVYSSDGFNPEYSPRYPQYFIGVTEEQLKTPEYLRSLGFQIVVG